MFNKDLVWNTSLLHFGFWVLHCAREEEINTLRFFYLFFFFYFSSIQFGLDAFAAIIIIFSTIHAFMCVCVCLCFSVCLCFYLVSIFAQNKCLFSIYVFVFRNNNNNTNKYKYTNRTMTMTIMMMMTVKSLCCCCCFYQSRQVKLKTKLANNLMSMMAKLFTTSILILLSIYL